MKKSDLHREWARVIDMCEGTNVEPRECLKIDNVECKLKHPQFGNHPKYYAFAVAIIEGKPVFAGDLIYEHCGKRFEWGEYVPNGNYQEYLTWTPPKRTITLNGEELPKPDDGHFYLYIAGFNHIQYGFKNGEDLIKVEAALNKLLRGE